MENSGCLKQAVSSRLITYYVRVTEEGRKGRNARPTQEEEKRTREATSEEEEQNRTERTRIRNKNYTTLYQEVR